MANILDVVQTTCWLGQKGYDGALDEEEIQ